jgi:hypothetical protein
MHHKADRAHDNDQKYRFRNRCVLHDGNKTTMRLLFYTQRIPYPSENFEQEELGNEDSQSKF